MSLAGVISIVIVMLGMATVVLGGLMFRGRRRSSVPECHKCRYELAGLPGTDASLENFEPVTCPECGHRAAKLTKLFRRRRRPAWLALVALGIAVLCEPLFFGNARLIYDHLPDSVIVYLHANWNDESARRIVDDTLLPKIRVVRTGFSDAHMLTLAEGAIARIERANALGEPERIDTTDLLILSWTKIWHPTHTPPAFASRVARAMPPLFAHPDEHTRWYACWLSCDFNDPSLTVAAVADTHDDPDPRVRAAAADSLFAHLCQGQDVAGTFVLLLDDADADVRGVASDRLRLYVVHSDPPPSLGPALETLEPVYREGARARALALLALLPDNERLEACRTRLREGTSEQRWQTLLFVSHRPSLTTALLPEWGKAHHGDIQEWLQARRRQPIDEVLIELGFE